MRGGVAKVRYRPADPAPPLEGTRHSNTPPAMNNTTKEVMEARESPVVSATTAISIGPRKLANLPIML